MALPSGLPGERNVVLIAFRRDQQRLVDSWVPWLELRAANDPEFRFVEVPAIGLQWQPARAGYRWRHGGGDPRRDDVTADRVHRRPPGNGPPGHRRPQHDLAVPDTIVDESSAARTAVTEDTPTD